MSFYVLAHCSDAHTSQSRARCWALSPGVLRGWQAPSDLSHHCISQDLQWEEARVRIWSWKASPELGCGRQASYLLGWMPVPWCFSHAMRPHISAAVMSLSQWRQFCCHLEQLDMCLVSPTLSPVSYWEVTFFSPDHLLPIIGMMTSIVAGMCKVSTMCLFLLQELFQYLFTDSMIVTPISWMGRLISSSRIRKVILDRHWRFWEVEVSSFYSGVLD